MEVDEIETHVCKYQRVSSNGLQWPSSRIVRVSRASGGKDRHSKVLTSKGLRDRRVRLSVGTAIQFYDLQDRLGYDQPSKAVEWLLKAAAASIDELPSLDPAFSGELEKKLKSPAGSSTSETSKGSGLSLAGSENRVKARQRAREMAASKDKEKESVPENSSFTDLFTGGVSSTAVSRPVPTAATPMDYLFQTPQFSFLQESFVPAVTTAGDGGSYSLNFSGVGVGVGAGLARGTLQSNLQSSFLPLHRLQDGSNLPFFILQNGVVSEHFPATVGYDAGTGGRHSDHHKEKANN